MNIISYYIAKEENTGKLMTSVKDKIKDGWEPIGGISCEQGTPFPYMQAMIKREEPKP